MKKYQCHKIVEAAQIVKIGGTYVVVLDEDGWAKVDVPDRFYGNGCNNMSSIGDYLVRYDDGYLSWSPKAVFEAGYSEIGAPAAVEVTVTAPAGKRAQVTMMRGEIGGSVRTVTEGQSQTWACVGGEILTVREGEPHSTVANKRDAS